MEDLADDDAFMGEENAPVTIVEFSEFQCPYCGKYFNDAYPQIMEKYVETGNVKYVFRDFPLSFHAGAYPAALASECVRDQGGDEAYFEMHDRLFENQNVLGYDSDTLKSTLVSYAEALGADKGEFLECYENDTFKEEIYADMSYGQSIGISGTPSFIVNGELLVGAQPFEAFEQIIEAALAE
jgi:protein-disulfide isomerase